MTARSIGGRWLLHGAVVAGCLLILGGCATWSAPVDTSDEPLRARAVTENKRGVQLSATVLGPDDSLRLFGTDVNANGMQPVWIEVRNDTDQVLWLLRSGTDPDYFSPLEVAWSAHVKFGGATNQRIDEHFERLAFPNPIPARGTRSGILFTNPQPVTKLLNVDLLGNRHMIPFTLFLPVGEGEAGQAAESIHEYPNSEIVRHDDLDSLRKALEALPCCESKAPGGGNDEPLNVVLVGQLDDIGAALVRRGFRRDATVGDTAGHLLFGRSADLYLRKQALAGASANWIRIWRAPISHHGQFVFVASSGRPVGGRFASDDSSDQRLHPDVDEVRNALIHDLMYSGGLEKLAFAGGVGRVPIEQPRMLADGDSYFTDGRRVVFFLGTRPLTISEVEVLDWEPIASEGAATTVQKPGETQR